jgi:hypothetical protein
MVESARVVSIKHLVADENPKMCQVLRDHRRDKNILLMCE